MENTIMLLGIIGCILAVIIGATRGKREKWPHPGENDEHRWK